MITPDIDIATLEAGELTDRLVAERVMGWHVSEYYYGSPKGPAKKSLWSPSTSIEAAFEVVEKVKASGMVIILGNDLRGYFSVAFFSPTLRSPEEKLLDAIAGREVKEPYFEAEAPTAPLAICRAALKVKEDNLNAQDSPDMRGS